MEGKPSKRLSLKTDQRPKGSTEEIRSQVTGKIGTYIKNSYYYSKPGKGEDGLTKVNQDNILVCTNLFGKDDFSLFCVMDGKKILIKTQ